MASLEDRVLTKILECGSLAEALRCGLTEDTFLNGESRLVQPVNERDYPNV